jgi:glyoxylase-like metal-dependent hydrolase (beta-lactamase superfamily II)
MRNLFVAAFAALTLSSTATSQPTPETLVSRAVAAIGGAQALRGIATVSFEFNSASFALGQEETPLSPARATVSSGRFFTDWRANRRAVIQELRQPTGVIVRQRQVIAGGIGMNEANGVQTPAAPAAVAGVLQGMRLQSDRLLLRALDDPAALSPIPPKLWRGELMDGVRFAQGTDTVSLYFDRLSGLLTVSELITDDPIVGDRHGITWYLKWQDAGGVKLPRQFDSYTNERLLSHNDVTALTINGTLADTLYAIPDSIKQRAQQASATAPAVVVNLVELAPGVWRAEGGTHHSLVIEQGARLVVIEAPQSAARFRAVLDTLKARFPTRRVGLVVNTHHHWDHAGGVRTALAAGLPVATHRRNVAFVRGIAAARKTVQPDALSRRQALPLLTAVGDSLVVGTGDRRVVLYQLPTSHVEGMLVAYLPAARLLFAADVLSPPVPPAAPTLPALGSAELVALVRARGIAVDRYAGAHGGVVAWADVERAAVPR